MLRQFIPTGLGVGLMALAAAADGGVTLTAGDLQVVIADTGRLQAVTGPPDSRGLLAPGQATILFGLQWEGQGRHPTSFRYDADAGRLAAVYGDTGVSVSIRVRTAETHLCLTLEQVRGCEPEAVTLVRLPVDIQGRVGAVVGVVRDDRTAIGVQALNIHTSVAAAKTPWGGVLVASAREDRGGVIGASIALFACPASEALARVGAIELAEGLPHPLLDGQWNKLSPTAHRPYLIIRYGVDTINRVLELAVRGGLRYVYHPGPFETWGHFVLNPREFPKGDASLFECVEKAEKVGVRLGLHTLSGFITTNDAFVTPVPDPRLARMGSTTITADVDSSADEIPVADATPFRNRQTLGAAIIGTELVTYERVEARAGVPVLMGVIRGAFGTTAAAHAKGDDIGKLADHAYRTLYPGIANGMVDEMTERLVELGNTCRLHMISFDGLEGLSTYEGGGDYPRNRFVEQCHRGWDHHVISGASNLLHYTWHWHARMNWGELTQSAKQDIDSYRAKNCEFYRDNLLPAGMGWWRIGTYRHDWEATRLEDIEYLLAKAAGNAATHALQTHVDIVKQHGLAGHVLDVVREWDEARFSGAFSEEQLERLREPGCDFRLTPAAERAWDLAPVRYGPFHWVCPVAGATGERVLSFASTGPARPGMPFVFANPYERQPLRFEIRCLPAYEYGHVHNIDLMPPDPGVLVREPGLHQDAPTVEVVSDGEIEAHAALRLTARYEGTERVSYVTRLCYSLPEKLDLRQNRGLGVWVEGDGRGETLFVEIQDGKAVRPFYIPIDFVGIRYIELPLGEVSLKRYYDYEWNNWTAFSSWWVTLKGFQYGQVKMVTVGYNAIPPETTVSCRIAGIQALRELPTTVRAVTFSIGGRSTRVPVELKPLEYLSRDDGTRIQVRDGNFHPLREVELPDNLDADAGPNRVSLAVECDGSMPWLRFQGRTVGVAERVTGLEK